MTTNLYSVFLIIFFCSTSFAFSEPASSTIEKSHNADAEIRTIDEELQNLNRELSDLRKKALNAEMDAQPQMIDSWHEFAENIRLSEKDEQQVLSIKERIRRLNLRKQELMKAK